MDYAGNGNILTKSDLAPGEYTYNHPTKPYAVTEINSANQVIPSATQSAIYTSFEQVSTIDEDDYHAAFIYNSDDQRAKMLVTDLGSTILTRWYVGSQYIKETESAVTKEYTWIGGDAYSAPAVAVKEGANTTWYYLLRDYLGNITHVVNTSNTVTAEYSYDAWGRRRDKDDWSYTLSSEPELFAGRSFTSHEYLPWFKLVNMNGRLYDPVVGRFLSADPFVQMPDVTQNFNRYSYCLNNPLKFTDPDGKLFKELLGIIGAISSPVTFVTSFLANGFSFKEAWRDAGNSIKDLWDAGKSIDNQLFNRGGPSNSITGQPGSKGTPHKYTNGGTDYKGYYFEDYKSMVNFMWEKSNDPTVNVEISGYILMDDDGNYYYWVNDWTGNTNSESNNPWFSSNDPKYKGHALFDRKIIVTQVHTHPKSFYEEQNALGKYDGPSVKDYNTSVNMNVPVYTIGPKTVSVITPKSPYKTETDFKNLASGYYGLSKKRENRIKTNPFYWAETNDWLQNPTYVLSW
jgi:RHS repeat-associated protein